ncbi:hypothetical protein MTO96_030192 [Rhipicephalus appendiculatus]
MAEGMVIVDGEDLPPDEFGAEHGWRSAAVKKNAQRVSRRDSAREAANSQGHRERLSGSRKPISLKSKIIKSSRMPQLPKEHWKIIARPRGGLDVQKTGSARLGRAVAAAAGLTSEQASQDIVCPNATQNIIVLSTASRANADAYLKMNCITLGIKKYELSTYEAAPHATCKGVIRQIDVSESQADLERSIINDRNPLALGAKRIKNSETVVVVFDGYKVPNFIFYGSALVRCSLYLRQHDCCYACGRLGHRADVCPTPEDILCRKCGATNPDENHTCSPTCGLCGGPHATADKTCKQRFQLPYIVRRRRRERNAEYRKRDVSPAPTNAGGALAAPSSRRSRSRRRSKRDAETGVRAVSLSSRSSSRSRSGSRGRSRSSSRTRHSHNRALSKSPSRSRSRGSSKSRGHSHGPPNRVRFEKQAGPGKQGSTWADRVRSGGRPAEKSLVQPPRLPPSPELADVPMVVEASHSSNPAKRKAVSSMTETVQAKAKSEIREMLNSICFEIQKINERLSAVDQRLLVMDQKIDAQNVKIACVENRVQGTESKVQEMDIRTSTSVRLAVFKLQPWLDRRCARPMKRPLTASLGVLRIESVTVNGD